MKRTIELPAKSDNSAFAAGNKVRGVRFGVAFD